MSCVPLVGHLSYMGPWGVGPPGQDRTLGMGSFQGVPCYSRGPPPCVLCTISQPFVSHGTLGCGPSNSRQNTLECSHPRVFHVIPGAHIPVAHVPLISHSTHMGHWGVGPPSRDETPGMGSFQGVLCHSGGPHPHVPCTIGRPFVSHGTLGCAQ